VSGKLWRSLLFTAFTLLAPPTRAQDVKPTPQPADQDEIDVLRVKSNLVNIEVMVKDKRGKFVTDLRAEDFTVYENGSPQQVTFFESPLLVAADEASPADAVRPGAARAPATAGGGGNIISLVLDGQTTDLANMKQVREGIIKYIREQVTDTDVVALFAIAGDLRLLQPFTQDKARLISAVERAYSLSTSGKGLEQQGVSENIGKLEDFLQSAGGASPSSASITNGAAGSAQAQAMIASRVLQQFVKLRSALSEQQSRPILASLAAICEAQRAVPGKKTLVLFSQGFVTPSTLDWQVQSTIDIANRANVAVYVIDSAGLKASAPLSGGPAPPSPLGSISALTGQEQRIQAVGGETVFDYARQLGSNRGEDILYRISGDTGGQFIKNTNDIARGLGRVDQEIRARYTLAYQSTDPNFDGGFRKLKVEVRRPGTQVVARKGYYALAHDEVVSLSPEEKKILAGINSVTGNPDLPLSMELPAFRFQEGRYVIPLSIEVPPGNVKFDRKNDRQLMQLDVLGVVREREGAILSRLGGSFNVTLTSEQYRLIQNNNIFYRQDIILAPGTYGIDLLVKDKLSGKMTARREQLVLPVAGAEFSTSGIVLSRYAELAPKELSKGAGVDVLSQGGAQVRPSPGREFRPADNLIIFFELYNAATHAGTSKPQVRVSVTLMKDERAVTRPVTHELTEVAGAPVPHLTFSKYIKLEGLQAGSYTARIEARDMVSGKLLVRQAAFSIK
jgi:VWFA-related protein